jgi:hypothetical protein
MRSCNNRLECVAPGYWDGTHAARHGAIAEAAPGVVAPAERGACRVQPAAVPIACGKAVQPESRAQGVGTKDCGYERMTGNGNSQAILDVRGTESPGAHSGDAVRVSDRLASGHASTTAAGNEVHPDSGNRDSGVIADHYARYERYSGSRYAELMVIREGHDARRFQGSRSRAVAA